MVKHVVVFIFTSIVGVMLFLVGYHNVDLSVNFMKLGIEGYDETVGGKILKLEDVYLVGIRLMWVGFALMVGSVFGMITYLLQTQCTF